MPYKPKPQKSKHPASGVSASSKSIQVGSSLLHHLEIALRSNEAACLVRVYPSRLLPTILSCGRTSPFGRGSASSKSIQLGLSLLLHLEIALRSNEAACLVRVYPSRLLPTILSCGSTSPFRRGSASPKPIQVGCNLLHHLEIALRSNEATCLVRVYPSRLLPTILSCGRTSPFRRGSASSKSIQVGYSLLHHLKITPPASKRTKVQRHLQSQPSTAMVRLTPPSLLLEKYPLL